MSEYFEFKSAHKVEQVHNSVKGMTYEEIESTFKGKLDWVALAAHLGKKPSKKKIVKPE